MNHEGINFYIKSTDKMHASAWVEDWQNVFCTAELIVSGKEQCLIDTIETRVSFRNMGYATYLIKELQKIFKEVKPIGIESRSQYFWSKLDMEDALGQEL